MTVTPRDVQPVQSVPMPGREDWNITKHRSIRIEDELWADLDRAAKQAGVDRSTVVRQLVRWYLRVPGAKPPQRPDND